MKRFLALLALALVLACCGDSPADMSDAGQDAALPDTGPPDAFSPPPFALTSDAFAEGEMIPLRYECGPPLIPEGTGGNITPALSFTAGPSGAMSYAIVVRDRDAGNLVHWVLYDIPAETREIPENVRPGYMASLVPGARQAELQGSGYFGYLGPCSPGRVNTYEFTVHALPTETLPGVDRTTTEDDIAAAVEAASIASASLSGES